MVSADGKTVLVLLSVDLGGREASDISDGLYKALDGVQVEHYYTGNWLIQNDVVKSSEEGLAKTEGITVVFILAILFVVFRSAIAPFVPLLTVGISYIASQSIVAFLAEHFDFPLSTFTQIFMVAVMFGIGTDYCILLISRFKEELAHNGGDKVGAILSTYRTAGKTVLFSGLAVLIGFASIGFSTFVLYRSAVAVAVGVAVLLIAVLPGGTRQGVVLAGSRLPGAQAEPAVGLDRPVRPEAPGRGAARAGGRHRAVSELLQRDDLLQLARRDRREVQVGQGV